MHTRQSARRGAAAMASAVAQPLRHLALAGLLLAGSAVHAQDPAPPGMDPKTAAARRFPQPVRVGSLIWHTVLRPVESQDVLGKVDRLIRREDGGVDVVVDYGGLFGFGARPIAVPIEAMVVLGDVMEIVDLMPAQLDKFPTFEGHGTTPLLPDEIVKVGLARPSH
jgi:hypothetical protein